MNPHSISTYRPSRWRQPSWWLLVLTAAMLPLFIFGWALMLGSWPAAAAPADQVSWNLVWSDEFNGSAGTKPDAAKWNISNGHSGINTELEYYHPDLVYLDGAGNLVLESRKGKGSLVIPPGEWDDGDYYSGQVNTSGKFDFMYGKIEIRESFPSGKGYWPASWTLRWDCTPYQDIHGCNLWPPEIDFIEYIGTEPTNVYQTYHDATNGWSPCMGCRDLSVGFHTFGIEWYNSNPREIKFFYDGIYNHSSTGTIDDIRHHVLIQTAIGGSWPGNPDASTVFPGYHKIDYIRYYQQGSGATFTPVPTATRTNTPTPLNVPARIEAGGAANYTDSGGNVWVTDTGFVGGGTVDRGNIAIANTVDDKIYQTERWGLSGYNFNIANGTYTVNLHFAETASQITGAGQRLFSVNVEGQTLTNLDVYAQAGGKNIALIKTFNNVNVTDGALNMTWTANVEQPMVNGIEILPVGSPTATPTNTPTRTNTPVPPTATPTPTPGGAYDDEFNVSALAAKWSWIREDATKWSLTAAPGFMRIICQAGDINGATATAKNILLETAPTGDWTIVTKLTGKPTANWAQAGLIVYQNDDNWVKMVRLYDNANVFQFAKEIAGTFTFQEVADGIASATSYLKIVKSGTSYSGYYSADGVSYTQAWTAQTVSLSTIKIGLLSFAGTGLNADFDYLHVTTAAPTATPTNTLVPSTATPTPTNTPVPGNTHSGTWAAKAVLNSPQSWKNLWQTDSGIATNTNYVAGFWIKGVGSIEIHVHDPGWTVKLSSTRCNATSTWTQCTSAAFNTGSNTSLVIAIGDAYNDDPVGTVYLDDAFLGVSGGANKAVDAGFESGNVNWINDDATIYSILQNP